jgi:NAD(P)H-dependent FMN reductase
VKLLTVCGSLRAGSSNAALLAALALVAGPAVEVEKYDGLSALPAFNPDMEEDEANIPAAVVDLRRAVATADAIVISSPEYAHGIPGALKNALDWLVGSLEFVNKPVGLINASSASRFAHPQLVEVLTVMNANVVPGASLLIDIPRRGATAEELATNPDHLSALRSIVAALAKAS